MVAQKYERQLTSFVIASSCSRNRKWARKPKIVELKSINFGILSYNFRYIIENIENTENALFHNQQYHMKNQTNAYSYIPILLYLYT